MERAQVLKVESRSNPSSIFTSYGTLVKAFHLFVPQFLYLYDGNSNYLYYWVKSNMHKASSIVPARSNCSKMATVVIVKEHYIALKDFFCAWQFFWINEIHFFLAQGKDPPGWLPVWSCFLSYAKTTSDRISLASYLWPRTQLWPGNNQLGLV